MFVKCIFYKKNKNKNKNYAHIIIIYVQIWYNKDTLSLKMVPLSLFLSSETSLEIYNFYQMDR
jgi:hypothetical protein